MLSFLHALVRILLLTEDYAMQDARIRIALILVCLACLLGSAGVLLRGRQTAPPPIVFSAPSAAAPPGMAANSAAPVPAAPPAPRPARLFVDVAGAVRRPSVYVLPRGSRVMQALLAAGGPAADADTDAVNLAEMVTDGEKVFVPKRGAAPAPASQMPFAVASAAKTAPAALSATAAKGGRNGGSKGAGSGRISKISADSGEQIGLNSATSEQLERLPEVGPSMAAKILAYRQQSGGFQKIDDLSLVPGIGPKKLAKLTPFVSLN
jgi:competence protein ComEA